MSKVSKIVFYGATVLALLFYASAFVFIEDKPTATYLVANACFCALWSVWAYVDSKVDL